MAIRQMWIESTGWMLIHSVWIGILFAGLACIGLRLLRRRSANVRYLVACLCMAGSLASLPASFLWAVAGIQQTFIAESHLGAEHVAPNQQFNQNRQRTKAGIRRRPGDETALNFPLGAPTDSGSGDRSSSSQIENAPFSARSFGELESTLRPYHRYVVMCWLTGAILFSLRPLYGVRFARRLKTGGLADVPDSVKQTFDRLIRQIGVRRVVALFQSSLVEIPCVVGTWRPVVLLPLRALTGLSAEQLEAVLAHELAHVRRFDDLINSLQILTETLFFYHPAIWWLSGQIRIEREHCCDDMVVDVLQNPAEYCRALLVIEGQSQEATHPLFALTAADGSLVSRVRRIAGRQPAVSGRWPIAIFATLLLVSVIVFTTGWAKEQKPAVAKASESAMEAGMRLDDVAKVLAMKHRKAVTFDAGLSIMLTFERFPEIKAADILGSDADLKSHIELIRNRLRERLARDHCELAIRQADDVIEFKVVDKAPEATEQSLPAVEISGTVRDSAGQVVVGVTVEIANCGMRSYAVTDGKGAFRTRANLNDHGDWLISAIDEHSHSGAAWVRAATFGRSSIETPVVQLVMKPVKRLRVQVVDDREQPASQAQVGAAISPWDIALAREGRTDRNGRVDLLVPDGMEIRKVFAIGAGKGIAFTADDARIPVSDISDQSKADDAHSVVRLRLSGARPLIMKVQDENGSPLAGVRLYPWYVSIDAADNANLNFSTYTAFGREVTNKDGIVVFDWIPKSGPNRMTFFHESSDHVHRYLVYDVDESDAGPREVTLEKRVTVSGHVYDKNDQPAPDVTVIAAGADFSGHHRYASTTTDKDGSYQLHLFPRALYTICATSKDQKQVGLLDGVHILGGQPMTAQNIRLKPGARIFGRLMDEEKKVPLERVSIKLTRNGPDLRDFDEIAFREIIGEHQMKAWAWIGPELSLKATTNADGRFEIWLCPGDYLIDAPDSVEDSQSITGFEVTDLDELEFEYQYDREYWRLLTKGGVVPKQKDAGDE